MNLCRPVRMHLASVGISKFCFLFSLAFCGLLLLLIPALQPPTRQVDQPQPRPHTQPARLGSPQRVRGVFVHAGKTDSATELSSSAGRTEGTRDDIHGNKREMDSTTGTTPGGKGGQLSSFRSRDPLDFKDIFIAVKTTRKYHKSRLELLIQTWVDQAKEQVRRAPLLSSFMMGLGTAFEQPFC